MSKLLLKEHFDRAVRRGWRTDTCIIAQLAKDNGDIVGAGINRQIRMDKKSGVYVKPYGSDKARDIMKTFDRWFGEPGDEKKPPLQELRRSLPIEL